MSYDNRKNAQQIATNEQLSLYSIMDWIWPYKWVYQGTLGASMLSNQYGGFLKMIMWIIFMTILWPWTNLVVRFYFFYIASLMRLINSVGGKKSLTTNIIYVLGYTAFIIGFQVPFVIPNLPFMPEYYTYKDFFEWLKIL